MTRTKQTIHVEFGDGLLTFRTRFEQVAVGSVIKLLPSTLNAFPLFIMVTAVDSATSEMMAIPLEYYIVAETPEVTTDGHVREDGAVEHESDAPAQPTTAADENRQ